MVGPRGASELPFGVLPDVLAGSNYFNGKVKKFVSCHHWPMMNRSYGTYIRAEFGILKIQLN